MVQSVLNNKRLLAVDDEPDILETLKEQFDDFPGLVLDTATDYETGYHLIRSWTYDLVILDIMGVRGFDLLNAAVSLEFPTVMLTATPFPWGPEEIHLRWEPGPTSQGEDGGDRPFLEDVLALSYRPGWKRVFEKAGRLLQHHLREGVGEERKSLLGRGELWQVRTKAGCLKEIESPRTPCLCLSKCTSLTLIP